MRSLRRKCLNIMKIELEDLAEDLKHMVEAYEKRKQKGDITNYVFLENIAVLKHEMYGVKAFSMALDDIEIDDYNNLDEMVNDIEKKLKEKIITSDYAEALYPIIKRRLRKVSDFVKKLCI